MRRQFDVTAPGKLLLLGEYSVAFGGIGIAMAVDRRAWAAPAPDEEIDPENLVDFCRAHGARALGDDPPDMAWRADSSRLLDRDVKMGLGSSAAVAAAAVASLLVERGTELRTDEDRRQLWRLAFAAHRAFQRGAGSGIDVAAAAFGGVVCLRSDHSPPQLRTCSLPRDLHLVPVWTGRAASTRELLAAVRRGAADSGETFKALLAEMRDAVESIVSDDASPDARTWVSAAGRYRVLMDRLAALTGAGIVTPLMRRLTVAAEELDGSAKPSGAGGGDVVLGFFDTAGAAAAFSDAAADMGATPVELVLDQEGAVARDANVREA